ncbi:nicastrin-like [Lytechinus pictus]|uniref:nicastrin-like n=1 Tax=Lytechinus pictus TaxID=7653 RepID=UPI0030B9F06A
MIYYDIMNFGQCVRRFNATHQIGCTSDFNGNNGVLHLIENVADINWLLVNGTYTPYIALMTPQMFTLENVRRLLDSGKVNGIMVDHSDPMSMISDGIPFSPDKSCPNDNYGMYADNSEYSNCQKVLWNTDGNGMSFMDLGIPVFALTNSEDVQTVKDCYEEHNRPDAQGKARPYPQCAGEMYDFMFGAKDTPTCMWRTQRITNLESSFYCDPLGDWNVWATLVPTNKSNPLGDESMIIAAAQLDVAELFYSLFPSQGAENTVSGFVTLLAAAQAIGALPLEIKQDMKNIMFTFFQGESYDYIGSSRMVYDMKKGVFPFKLDEKNTQPSQVNLSTVAAVLEVRQLALSEGDNFYMHIDPLSQSDASTQQGTERLMQLLKSYAVNVTMNNVSLDQPLPPASFQQFLRNGTDIPGVVITDHNMEYKNKYYNSRLDIPEAFGINFTEYNSTDYLPIFPVAQTLTGLATTIARSLYLYARPGANASILVADVNLVNDLLYCFNERPNCSRIREAVSPDDWKSLSNSAYSYYVGVDGHHSSVTILVGKLLSYYLGLDKEPMTQDAAKENCKDGENDQILNYHFVAGPDFNGTHGLCVKSTQQIAPAVSPAFDADNPDWSSTIYSTWTESQWGSYRIRAFLKPSRSQETVTFSMGMIVLIVSLTSAYFLNKRSDDLFP